LPERYGTARRSTQHRDTAAAAAAALLAEAAAAATSAVGAVATVA